MELRSIAELIIREAIASAMPNRAVKKALAGRSFPGRVYLVTIGKAGWQMAKAAAECLGEALTDGVVITKYGHVKGEIPLVRCYEAGHPIPDANSYSATEKALELVKGLDAKDTVIFLVSGGGSALFEKPLISGEEMAQINARLLAGGADITKMNTIRKRLSAVKGGRFGVACHPAKVLSIILSDVLGDPLDMIASGPAYPDHSSTEDAKQIIENYHLPLSPLAWACIDEPLPAANELSHVETIVTGSVTQLCTSAAATCIGLGIPSEILTDRLCCEARLAGKELARIAANYAGPRPMAFIEGGETVVRLTGTGKGGRNQEVALAAAEGISGMKDTAIFSVGSDGTDGPTDAAGGYVDGGSFGRLISRGIRPDTVLQNNDAYHALKPIDGLIMTGPTGTNVNDLSVLLLL